MNSPTVRGVKRTWVFVEATAAGLAYAGGLCWASVCLVASFRPGDLSSLYWHGVPGLRTDTCGIIAFLTAGVCFGTCDYLRLRRGQHVAAMSSQPAPSGTARLLGLTTSKTVAILATGLFVYLSVNAVSHPVTLNMRATHLAPWPTEGTLRVMALFLCAGSVMVQRCLYIEDADKGGTPQRHFRHRSEMSLQGVSTGGRSRSW
jgi:hypothetical protein